ncbi:DNA-protecting protein DprA [Arthrobacter agilis]|uniref:DNA-processing protein DprA n=1 Tax=Arthrobacter agilis TaxID=37921 RepID=UPI000B3560B6|nr:DNA-processing protein DprA [Arthrobacter agilis]OUM44806.1 DNA protecting protein DprA [Arthrobacter agilis]PPB47130.1 DNA-protecting protein DprA [Arthrobacter agilis]TPV22544.1 DNA-protecting protein DprA [Arthrobacter agilis]VDR32367.1 Transposase and inactivated derivatives [Arthrobacter agilis]
MTASVPETSRARAALSRLFEPSDTVGLGLAAVVGPVDALRIARGDLTAGREVRTSLYELLGMDGDGRRDHLQEGLDRWAPRVPDLAPDRDLATLGRLSGRLVTPESGEWPAALDDLQSAAPLCLWVRGVHAVPPLDRLAAVVGSRDSTSYGASVTAEMASGLVLRGYSVVSGGAYGIDAQAHRAALASGDDDQPPTVAILACGVDRYYPAGNEELLRVIASRGLLISEVPPGSSPTRWRFLQRNRVIAALSGVTVVVEARWRSGALNTAHHAAGLGRPVGAVPGSVHSANSAGCHRLLRDGTAVCVTDAADVAELAGPIGSVPTGDRLREATAPVRDQDGLTIPDLLVLDALPVRSSTTVDKLAVVAGLAPREVLSGLARLELAGLAIRTSEGWLRQKG